MTIYWKGGVPGSRVPMSLLKFAVYHGNNFELIEFLIANNVDIHGLSLLHLLQNER